MELGGKSFQQQQQQQKSANGCLTLHNAHRQGKADWYIYKGKEFKISFLATNEVLYYNFISIQRERVKNVFFSYKYYIILSLYEEKEPKMKYCILSLYEGKELKISFLAASEVLHYNVVLQYKKDTIHRGPALHG